MFESLNVIVTYIFDLYQIYCNSLNSTSCRKYFYCILFKKIICIIMFHISAEHFYKILKAVLCLIYKH